MLRVKDARADRGRFRLPIKSVLALVTLLGGCVTVAVAGPGKGGPAVPAPPPLDGSLIVPMNFGDLNGAFVIRVGEIFAAPERAELARELNEVLLTKLKQTGVIPLRLPVRVQDMEQFIGRLTVTVKEDGAACTLGISAIRMNKACDWAKIIKAELPEVKEVRRNGATVYEQPWAPPHAQPSPGLPPFQLYVSDERTIVLEGGSAISRLIEANKKAPPSPIWEDDWKEVQGWLVAMVIDDPEHRYAAKLAKAGLGAQTAEYRYFSELKCKIARHASRLVFGLDNSGGLRLKARFTCDTAEDAGQLEKLLLDEIALLSAAALKARRPAGQTGTKELEDRAQFVRSLLAGASLGLTGNQVVLTATSRKHGVADLGRLLGLRSAPPAVGPSLAEPAGAGVTRVSAESGPSPLPTPLPVSSEPGLPGGMPPLPQPSSASELLGYPLPAIQAPPVPPGRAKR